MAESEIAERIAARRAELDGLEEQLVKQLEEVRAERDEIAVAERVWQRMAGRLAEDSLGSFRRTARPGPAQVTALFTEHPHLEVEPTLRELHIAPSTYYRWRRARRNRAFGLSAGGAWAPEPGLRSGAGAADGGVGGAGVDTAEPSADGAVSRASVAAAAAGQPGELRECAGCGAAEDRAEQCGQGVNERRVERLFLPHGSP